MKAKTAVPSAADAPVRRARAPAPSLSHRLGEAQAQQAATANILRIISRSRADAQPVFDTIAAAVIDLCAATSAVVLTFDGTLLHIRSLIDLNPGAADAVRTIFPRPPSRDNGATRAVLTRSVVVIPDVREDPDFRTVGASEASGFRSVLAVPLMRDGEPIGSISVGRAQPGKFSEAHVALLQSFADQAVIAIENVRLVTELEARNAELMTSLERQTATSEILRVISSSPASLQPVFDAIVSSAVRLCDADHSIAASFDGELLHPFAFHGFSPEALAIVERTFPMRPSMQNMLGRATLMRRVDNLPDMLADPSYSRAFAEAGGWRSGLAVPMFEDGRLIGAIAVSRKRVGAFGDHQVELLRTFAEQAVIAVRNVHLFTELQARTAELSRSVAELGALSEVGQAVSSTLDLETVLGTVLSRAIRLTGMDGGSIYEYDAAREEFDLRSTEGLPDELVEMLRVRPIRKAEGALGRLAVTGEPVRFRDISNETLYQSRLREILIRLGYRSMAAVPLLCEDRLLGGLVVNRRGAEDISEPAIELLQRFATQSALAIQNARLFREVQLKSRQLEAASRHKSEFLASMSHELRTPLNAIIGFSEVLIERMFGDVNDKQLEYLHDIHASGQHLLVLINDILDLSKIEAGRMELELRRFDLAHLLDDALTLVRERASRHAVALVLDVEPTLGDWVADERKVKQVVINLLSNAVKFTPDGGRITLRARRGDDRVEIAVIDTGVGIAPEDQALVFDEFRQARSDHLGKSEGTGLGLALVKRFVELHGGTIRVDSTPGRGSTFAFMLPRREPGATS